MPFGWWRPSFTFTPFASARSPCTAPFWVYSLSRGCSGLPPGESRGFPGGNSNSREPATLRSACGNRQVRGVIDQTGNSWMPERKGLAAKRCFHRRGVNSATRLAGCSLMRYRTSTRQVNESMPCSRQVTIKLWMIPTCFRTEFGPAKEPSFATHRHRGCAHNPDGRLERGSPYGRQYLGQR
jgi:hypothetical protein